MPAWHGRWNQARMPVSGADYQKMSAVRSSVAPPEIAPALLTKQTRKFF
jgi:hypothetical protein